MNTDEKPTVRAYDRLAELEGIIEAGLNTFSEVGEALLEIRDQKLYIKKFKTFETYCNTVWSIKRRRAYQLMEAASVVQNFAQMEEKPESQARELAKLPTEERKQLYAEAETETDGKVTAKTLNELVKRRTAPVGDSPAPPKSQDPADAHNYQFKRLLAELSEDLEMVNSKYPERANEMATFLTGWIARFRDMSKGVVNLTDTQTLWPAVWPAGK